MKESEIRKAFERIEPTADAKERMYQRIEQKAQSAKPVKKSPVIRFVRIAVPLAACLGIAFLGVVHFMPSEQTKSDSSMPIDLYAAPYQEVEAAENFEDTGISIDAPDGAENVSYAIIDGNTVSIDFSYNGHSYSLRASEQSGDFSGISGEIVASEQFDSKTSAVLYQIDAGDEIYLKAQWSDGKVHYFLTNTDQAEGSEVKSVALLLIEQS